MEGYSEISGGFDKLAAHYEDLIEKNPIHAHLRQRSLAWLDEAFRPGIHVLEIGCGTGTEAAHLGWRGVRVTAVDISERMVLEARRRIQEANLEDRVQILHSSSAEIASRFAPGTFDGAYASFGALNCGPGLRAAARDVGGLLKKGAAFVTSVISRPCAWEITAGLLHLDPTKAFRRLREPTLFDLTQGVPLAIHTYSEADLRRAFSPEFRIERLEGWLVMLPPPYLAHLWKRVGSLHAPAYRAEEFLSPRWPFRGWGEHIHMWARRCG